VGKAGVVFPAIPSGTDAAEAAFKGKGVDVSAFTQQVKDNTTFLFPLTDHAAAISQIMLPAMDSVMNYSADPDSLSDANDQVNSLFLFSE
jgi:multiple sugar transport system substrate-binding protein